MSCLLHALGTRELMESGNANSPDKHGGFEMGTWTFPSYTSWFEKIIGHPIEQKGSHYAFIKTDAAKIAKAIEPFTSSTKSQLADLSPNDKKILQQWHGIGAYPINPSNNPILLNDAKHYRTLHAIFTSESPVWYWK